MKLSAVVPVKNAAQRLPRLLEQLALIADELVVLIDTTTTDESEAVARTFTDCVYPVVFDPNFTNILRDMIDRCSGDWILWLDDDETLSPAWTRSIVNQLIANKRITHYYIPRRWLTEDGSAFLCNAPWYPNFAIRLIRNVPTIIQSQVTLHNQRRIAGEAGYLTSLAIHHWNFAVYDRAQRERKVEEYIKVDPANPCSEFYLYEDYFHQDEPYVDRASDFFPLPVRAGTEASPYAIDLFVRQAPLAFFAGQMYAIDIEMHNRSSRVLAPELPYHEPRNLSFSHHWYMERDGARTVYEYGSSRTPLSTAVAPGETYRALVDVRVPAEPGEYLLTFDMVEEFVAWFGEAEPTGHRESRRISVRPR